jgi:RNA polymerase sigma-70 factor (ECF subfamily)
MQVRYYIDMNMTNTDANNIVDQNQYDAELVRQYINGNVNALEMIYDRHANRLLGYLIGIVGYNMAEDVLQEVFADAERIFTKYEEKGKFSAWLTQVCRLKSLDMLRKTKRRRETMIPEGAEQNIKSNESTPDNVEYNKELRIMINKAVEELPGKQKEVFLLREEAKLSFKEISEMLGLPLNTALSHMRRATENLRQSLSALEEYIMEGT